MPSHAELAAKLLKDAAGFFRSLASQNADIRTQMNNNAAIYEQVAQLVLDDPAGMTGDKRNAQMAGGLLQDAAKFFRNLGDKNPPIKELMDDNARVFEQLGALTAKDPLGILN